MFKKHMVPPTKGGQARRYEGKGAQSAPMMDRRVLNALASAPNAGLNDYAKTTPMAMPMSPLSMNMEPKQGRP